MGGWEEVADKEGAGRKGTRVHLQVTDNVHELEILPQLEEVVHADVANVLRQVMGEGKSLL